jgi:hypothetical protein
MSGGFYVTLSSDGSRVYVNDNKPADFRIHLLENLDLSQGQWKVGVSSFQCNNAIDNLSEESISVWNGASVLDIKFSPNCCRSISKLNDSINAQMKPFTGFPKNMFNQPPHTSNADYETEAVPAIPVWGFLFKELMEAFDLSEIPPHNKPSFNLMKYNETYEALQLFLHPEMYEHIKNKDRRALEDAPPFPHDLLSRKKRKIEKPDVPDAHMTESERLEMNEVKINPQTRQIIRHLEDTEEEIDLLKTAKFDVVARQFINAQLATSENWSIICRQIRECLPTNIYSRLLK